MTTEGRPKGDDKIEGERERNKEIGRKPKEKKVEVVQLR